MSFVLNLLFGKSASSPVAVENPLSVDAADDLPKLISFSAKAMQAAPVQAAGVAEQKSYDLLQKIVLMGDSGAGKSSLLKRFTADSFSQNYCSTIGCDFAVRSIAFDGQVVKLQIWDTSGQERFRSITSSYYRGASGVLLVYANDCQASYAALAGWLNEARRSCAENTPVMIVCAKNDLPAKTDHNEARAWAESQGCLFAVTSAKNNDGVFDAFSAIAQTATGLAGNAVVSKDKVVNNTNKAPPSCLRVNLSELAGSQPVATGEPIRCCGCGAFFSVLSHLSLCAVKVTKAPLELAPPIHAAIAQVAGQQKGDRWWNCEMCALPNRVDATDEELAEFQRSSTMDFLVRAAVRDVDEASTATLFVVDVSGSMNTSLPVTRAQVPAFVREKRRQEFAQLLNQGEGYAPEQGNSFVSRLEMLQTAIERDVREIYAKQGDKARVGIVAFGSDVTVFAGEQPLVLAGDLLSDYEELSKPGRFSVVARPMQAVLYDLHSLREGGQTALGPALTVGVNNLGFGDRIVLATDGLANVGVGRMDADIASAKQVFVEAGENCRLRGVTTDILAIGEENAMLSLVCSVSDQSGGSVSRVAALVAAGAGEPRKEVLATSVLVMALLPRQLRFDGEADDEQERRNWLVKDMGVAHTGDVATFGFCWRANEVCRGRVPFQVQAVWTRHDGAQLVRVASASLLVSSAAAAADLTVEAQRAAQTVDRLVKSGMTEAARREIAAVRKRLGSSAHWKHFGKIETMLANNSNNNEVDDALIAQCHALKTAFQ